MSYDKKRLTSDLEDTAVQPYRKGEKIPTVGIIIGLTTGKQYITVQPLWSEERDTQHTQSYQWAETAIDLATGKQYIMVQPLWSGERYMAYPVIPMGRVAQVTLRCRALPSTSRSMGRSKGYLPQTRETTRSLLHKVCADTTSNFKPKRTLKMQPTNLKWR